MPGPAFCHVGEEISLSIEPAIPEGDSPIAVSWAMTGSPADVVEFEGYAPTTGPTAPPLPKTWPPAVPPSVDEAWHFLHAGVYTLEVELTAECPDGETASASGTFQLTAVAPAISGSVNQPVVSVKQTQSAAGNPIYLYRPGEFDQQGRRTGYIMTVELTPPANYPLAGSVIVVQTVSTNRKHVFEDGAQNILVSGGVALDNAYPYDPPEDWGAATPEGFAVSDAPTDAFVLNPNNPQTLATLDEHYEMYVLFQPDEDSTIPVPLGKFPWHWTAAATMSGGDLNIDSDVGPDPDGGPPFVTPCEAPFWTEVLPNDTGWQAIPAPPPSPPPPPDDPPPMSLEADSQVFGPVQD